MLLSGVHGILHPACRLALAAGQGERAGDQPSGRPYTGGHVLRNVHIALCGSQSQEHLTSVALTYSHFRAAHMPGGQCQMGHD